MVQPNITSVLAIKCVPSGIQTWDHHGWIFAALVRGSFLEMFSFSFLTENYTYGEKHDDIDKLVCCFKTQFIHVHAELSISSALLWSTSTNFNINCKNVNLAVISWETLDSD